MSVFSQGSPSAKSPSGNDRRRTRLTAPLSSARTWPASEAAPDRVGLYRRFTLSAEKQGWRLQPRDIEILLDIYMAYVRKADEPSTETCLRALKRLQRARV